MRDSLVGNASARRTTEEWKINLQARQNYARSTFKIGEETSKFNFNMQARFASIHNRLYIARRGATDEEILTQQRRLATNYSYFAFTSLSYTFGSVLNNVVNPRFGRGDGGNSSCFCF